MTARHLSQLLLLCVGFIVALSPVYTQEILSGTEKDDTLYGTVGDDEISGGDGNDILEGGDGDDVLRGGDGDDVLRGGNGNDILYGGLGIDRYYGGPGADRFMIFIDDDEIDEILDFTPEQQDTVFLHRKYLNDSGEEYEELNADGVRIDNNGDVEIRLNHRDWSKVVRLHEQNLELNSQELTGGLLLTFTRRF